MGNEQTICWTPSQAFMEQSNLHHFMQWLRTERQLSFDDYDALWQWSVTDLAAFWDSCWAYFGVMAHTPYTQVLRNSDMPGTTWFDGATLNYAEHLFRHRQPGKTALIFQNELGRKNIPWDELTQQVAAMQQFLVTKGIVPGDCVAAYLPNIPEAIACFMAVNALGAVWSCCSPDFGVDTVKERFAQISPKLLIAVDGYRYGGKAFSRLSEAEQIRTALPSITTTVLVPYLDADAVLPDAVRWPDVLAAGSKEAEVVFTAVPFDHPIWVLYSSGTTGRPKAITHSHGGVLLEHLKYMAFHNDLHAGEPFFWFSTTGWMMWNFLQASMLLGGIPVLYDGSPGYPDMDVLWRMAADIRLPHFGTSAPYLTACMRQGLRPMDAFDLSALRSIGSTGAPLPPEAFRWVYDSVSTDVWLCSMSGGTDVCTAFVGGNPFMTVFAGFIQSRALGCALYAYDEAGQRVTGSLGEMVIEQPMPSMPIYFWNDPDGKRYRDSYFADYPGKWAHGDWIKLLDNGSLIIQGRSDATLNRKGIRIGTAEIYNVLNEIPGIKDALVLNIELDNGDDTMPLFVVLDEDTALDEALQATINQTLRRKCSPRHVPDYIRVVPDIPYTLSGKKMEVPVKKIFLKMDIAGALNRDAVRNPDALDYFIALAEE